MAAILLYFFLSCFLFLLLLLAVLLNFAQCLLHWGSYDDLNWCSLSCWRVVCCCFGGYANYFNYLWWTTTFLEECIVLLLFVLATLPPRLSLTSGDVLSQMHETEACCCLNIHGWMTHWVQWCHRELQTVNYRSNNSIYVKKTLVQPIMISEWAFDCAA